MNEHPPRYLSGFGNEHATEALPGTLPAGQNAPQRPPRGLYTEQISGTRLFTAARAENRRSWLYRIWPSAMHPALPPDRQRPDPQRTLRRGRAAAEPPALGPAALPRHAGRFIDGLVTIGGNGDVSGRIGVGVHIYRATRPMEHRVFYDADGELLIVPQIGRLVLATELGVIEAGPGEIAVIPRGINYSVSGCSTAARGVMSARITERSSVCPSSARSAPTASPMRVTFAHQSPPFEDRGRTLPGGGQIRRQSLGRRSRPLTTRRRGLHGNYAPCVYDLARFNTLGTVSFDHPDPSIFTVLTSPSDTPGTANCDFVIFPPRWLVQSIPSSAALVPPQLYERVHGTGARRL